MDIIEKIDDHIVNEDIKSILNLALFMDEDDITNESKMFKKSKSILPKIGISVTKEGEGIFGKLKSKEMKEFFKQLFKAFRGDEDAKNKVKKMSKGKVNKGDIINLLLKLDAVTLHMISGPIHVLEYLTGWKISGVKKVKDIGKRIKTAIESLTNLANNLSGKHKKQVTNYISNIKRLESGVVDG
jgi:hypothetical protein